MIAHDASWHAFAALAVLSSYLLFSAGFHWLLCAARLFPADKPGERLATALLFGPVAGAWTFGAALRLFPSMPASFYLATCLGIWFAAGFAGRRALRADIAGHRAILARQRRRRPSRKTTAFLFVALAFGIMRILWVNAQVPPYANDPLEYLTVARLIAGKLALAGIYPAIDTEVTSGFYGPWTHPPGFVLLMSWVQILQGDVFAAGAVKFINTYFLIVGAWVVFVYAGGSLRYRGTIAALLYITTPILLGETFEHHVDVSRVALWTGAFLAVVHWARRPTLHSSILLGLLFGLGNYVHSIGLIALPIFSVLAMIVGRSSIPIRAANALVVIATAVTVIAPDLVTNLRSYGRLIGDSVELWDYAPLMVTEHLRYARGIFTPYEVLTLGLLSTFTRILFFGIAPWITLGLMPLLAIAWFSKRRAPVRDILRRAMRPTVFSVSVFAWLGFFGVTALTVLGGSELIIKNARYALTTIAFLCILAVQAGDLLLRLSNKRAQQTLPAAARANQQNTIARKLRSVLIASWPSRLPPFRTASHVRVSAAVLLAVGFTAMVHFQAARSIRHANIDSETALQPDQVQAGVTEYPQSRMISRLNRKLADGTWKPRGKVLSFRVGDIAYYGRFGYMSYIDPAVLPAFKAGTAREAGEVLSRIGVSYVATPPYSLPEIYNSALGALLANPALARIMDSDEGYTLYEVLEKPQTPVFEPSTAELAFSVIDAPGTELSVPKLLMPSGASDGIPSTNGEYVFSARLSGTGFVRIALMRGNSILSVLWEGLIPAEERLVTSHLDIAQLKKTESESSNCAEASSGVSIWLKSGSKARVSAASLKRIEGRASSEVMRVNYLSQLVSSGYEFGLGGTSPSEAAKQMKTARCKCSLMAFSYECLKRLQTALGFRLPGFPASKLEISPSPAGFSVLNLDGRKLSINFPELMLPAGDLGIQKDPRGRLYNTVKFGGAGTRELSATVQCDPFKPNPADENQNITVFRKRYLMVDADMEYAFEADVPCMAKSARLSVDMWRPRAGSGDGLPPLAYRFGENRMSFGFSDSEGGWQTREMLPLTGSK